MELGNQKTRTNRVMLVLMVYNLVLIGSFWLAYLLRFDFAIPSGEFLQLSRQSLWVIPAEVISLLSIGQCAGLLSYFSLPDVMRLFYGLALPSLVILAVWPFGPSQQLPPRSVLVINFVLSFGGLCCSRLAFRIIRERYFSPHGRPQKQNRRIGIIGAGDVGASLARDFFRKRGLGFQPMAFFDDDPNKWHSRVHNIPVVGPPELLAHNHFNNVIDEVVIAMPSAPAKRIKEIVTLLQKSECKFTTVPSMDQLATGKVSVTHLRPVDIEDLLGREQVTLDRTNIEQYIKGKVVLVTGAGGSIGSELCRQVAAFRPYKLLLLDQSEVQLFQIEQELLRNGTPVTIEPLIADVMDLDRMRQVFRRFQPHVIFHAAAHKHVPMMEHQPAEALKNNTFGTMNVARLALEHRVERFVLVSTDKAINPTSVMGATKRLAELFVQALQAQETESTKFMAVRFGNVLGSSGSVIPVFKQQIAAGGPITVTHPDVTRYFMTIPEAVSLVLQTGAIGNGGEIFVLDMGKPVKIVDLARQLIELSGFKPDEDIEIRYVGLRPGEKLFEELQHNAENLTATNHPKILRLITQPTALDWLCDQLNSMQECLHVQSADEIKLIIKSIVPEYTPHVTTVRTDDRPILVGQTARRLPEWKPQFTPTLMAN